MRASRLVPGIAVLLAWSASTVVLASVVLLFVLLLWEGLGAIDLAFFFGEAAPWRAMLGQAPVFFGVWPALVGTLSLIATATLLAVPVGLATGIWLTEFAPARQRAWLGFLVDLLAGVPSIVMGLFGFTILLLLRATFAPQAQPSLLLAASCLALVVLPYLIRATRAALEALPAELRFVGPSLGLSPLQALRHVLLPSASRGLWSGVILSIGRVAEDTAVIMLTGAVFGTGLPGGLLDRFQALPYRIYWLTGQYRNEQELAQGFGCALVLLAITAGTFALAFRLRRGLERRWLR